MLIIHTSNRLELLLERLADLLSNPGGDVFARRTVIVQSQGMARWLSLRLAERHGVCAGLDCPFPAAFLWRLVRAMEGEGEAFSPFDPEALTWAILDELEEIPREDERFRPVTTYLATDDLPARRYQLAERLARLFDQYMVFRPDWIRDWSAGGNQGNWQAALWRRLLARLGDRHRVLQHDALLARLDSGLLERAGVSGPVALFGIPALPPGQLEFFSRLSVWRDVHLFLLSPSREHWFEGIGERIRNRILLRAGEAADDAAALHLEAGNPLLASLGKTGREFQQRLAGLEAVEEERYAAPADGTLLATLQADILDDRDGGLDTSGRGLPAADGSFLVHVVHSPLREVEVLHDRLLDLFGRDATLHPRDILVMAPDVGAYAPLVETVFRAGPEGERIPFSIADRPPGDSSPLIRAFLELLQLAASRMPASLVIGFLETPAVSRRFGISGENRMRLRAWLQESGIHWGLDAEHRGRLGLAGSSRHTFRHGLDRLLLGLALPEDRGGSRFQGVLPCGVAEGGAGDLLARLVTFHERLAGFAEEAARGRTIAEWRDFLLAAMELLFLPSPDEEEELQTLRLALDDLVRASRTAESRARVPLETMAEALSGRLDQGGGRGSFLCGRVTFCQLAPMRSIPFRVIWLLGMNDGNFPRADRPPAFDLMASDPRPGDRSRREDDRYLFLETLLSARDCLCISYTGVDQRDNGERPPSPVVSEVLGYIARAAGPEGREAYTGLVIRHPLQPFSPRYFGNDSRLFTFSRDAASAASSLAAGGALWPGVFASLVLPPPELPQRVSLDAFIGFFAHPARALLKERLGVSLAEQDEELEDREVFSLDALERYRLFEAIAAGDAGSEPPEALFAREEERGSMPEGLYGRASMEALREEAEGMLASSAELREGGSLPGLDFELDCGGVLLFGRLDNRFPAGVVLGRPVKLESRRLRDRVVHWLTHLVANTLDPGHITTYFVARDGTVHLPPLNDAANALARLAAFYLTGMTRPLPLLPASSLVYMRIRFPKGSAGDDPAGEHGIRALDEASFRWLEGGYQQQPERLDPWLRLCFGDADPVRDSGNSVPGFAEVTEAVLAESWLREKK